MHSPLTDSDADADADADSESFAAFPELAKFVAAAASQAHASALLRGARCCGLKRQTA